MFIFSIHFMVVYLSMIQEEMSPGSVKGLFLCCIDLKNKQNQTTQLRNWRFNAISTK